MQAVPHPDTWFIGWLKEQKLASDEILRPLVLRLEEERRKDPEDAPTLGRLLERGGLLTREQREAGEREAAAREAEFMAWRSKALRDQAEREDSPPG